MGSDNPKIFIISLDGATFSVINPFIRQGYMPNLAMMMSSSVAADLESVVPPVTAPAWTSFMTGKHPNKHGVFDFARFDPEQHNWTINNARNIQSKTLWQILSEENKRVVVLNLPYTYPPYEVTGALVSGWDAPFTEASFSYPAGLSGEILGRFPDYKDNLWISELQPLRSDAQFAELTHKLKTGFEQQTKIAMDLLAREPWDVFMVHFQQTDWIQHKLWTYIEQGCSNPSDHSPKIEDTRNCYRHFDGLVGLLLEQAEVVRPRPTTIVLSDHGFGRLMGNIHPNSYLKEWGYLSVASETHDPLKGVKNLFRESKYTPLRVMYRSLAEAKNVLSNANAKDEHHSWTDNAEDVLATRGSTWDWKRTKAAVIYAYQMGFVYVNVIGRGPEGIVEPGKEYERLTADLISRFREIRHPDTGAKLLKDAIRGVDMYPAADNGILVPDLVLIPADGYGFSFSFSNAPPKISQEGTHRHNGILLINGESVAHPVSDFQPNLIDLAPTILHILGLAVPSDMDGRVLEEILTLDSSVRYEDVDNSVVCIAPNYEQAESDIIAQRLKGLGYLD
jgi:predicted AlkP superfamily phosphohydrolase/phosphomutase